MSRCSGLGLVNGWCIKLQRFSSSSHSNIGKIDHPGKSQQIGRSQFQPVAKFQAQGAQCLACRQRVVRDNAGKIPFFCLGDLSDFGNFFGCQLFGDGSFHAFRSPAQALPGLLLRPTGRNSVSTSTSLREYARSPEQRCI